MILDFHVHAFPDSIKKDRGSYFLGEPEFRLLYTSQTQKLVGVSEIIEMMDIQNISMSVIFGFPWNSYDTCYKNNDYILEAVLKYPDRLKGFCCVNPLNPMATSEVQRCLDSGLSGVGELAFYACGIDEKCRLDLEPIMELCKSRDVPVLVHANEEVGHYYPGKTSNTLGQIYSLIKRFPENKIVLAHWGGGLFFFNLLKKETIQILRNTYYDISASPFLYNNQVYTVAKEIIGVNKFIFGTDYPLLQPNRYLTEMVDAGLNRDDINKVCFENAAKLLKL